MHCQQVLVNLAMRQRKAGVGRGWGGEKAAVTIATTYLVTVIVLRSVTSHVTSRYDMTWLHAIRHSRVVLCSCRRPCFPSFCRRRGCRLPLALKTWTDRYLSIYRTVETQIISTFKL